MYRNYKIGPDGTPKYNGNSYRIAPERRLTKNTEEWERRLNSDPRKLRRRKKYKQETKFTLKVKHMVYAIILLIFIGVIGKVDTNNIQTAKSNQSINITLNSAVRDFGNEFIKPSNGNLFLHVNLNLENILNEANNINISEIVLLDKDNNKFSVSYVDNTRENMTLDLSPVSNTSKNFTFEIPTNYKGEMDLIFDNDNIYNQNVARFNIE